MKSAFHEAAAEEAREAVGHYDGIAPGLGDRFNGELKAAVRLIEEYPEASPLIAKAVRKKVLLEFPYTVFYRIARNDDGAAELAGASLEPLGKQGRYAPALLRLFEHLLTDRKYADRIVRHYQVFKATQRSPTPPSSGRRGRLAPGVSSGRRSPRRR